MNSICIRSHVDTIPASTSVLFELLILVLDNVTNMLRTMTNDINVYFETIVINYNKGMCLVHF